MFVSAGATALAHRAAVRAYFTRLGIPWPAVVGPFVGGVELAGGTMLLLGLGVRLASLPLFAIMLVAIAIAIAIAIAKRGAAKSTPCPASSASRSSSTPSCVSGWRPTGADGSPWALCGRAGQGRGGSAQAARGAVRRGVDFGGGARFLTRM
jgi:hypothetical protein